MQTCHRKQIFDHGLWLLMLLILAPATIAQTPRQTQSYADVPAHRRLDLPEHGTTNLEKQLFLMKQLKAMITGEDSAVKRSPKPSTENSAQLEQLKRMYEQFGSSLPPGTLPALEDISPEMIEQAKSNPAMRKYAQEMLEQYKRGRQNSIRKQRRWLSNAATAK